MVSAKEKEGGENLKNRLKRKFSKVESEVESESTSGNDGKTCFELQGRRVVELDVLAQTLDIGCMTLRSPLQLSNCLKETILGLGSFFIHRCAKSKALMFLFLYE